MPHKALSRSPGDSFDAHPAPVVVFVRRIVFFSSMMVLMFYKVKKFYLIVLYRMNRDAFENLPNDRKKT